MNRKILLAALLAAGAPAFADVTVTTQTSGKASFINVGGEGVNLFKGKRQRTDSTVGSKTVSLIIDIDNMRFVDLNDAKKTATVTPLASIADELEKVGVGAMQATLDQDFADQAGRGLSLHRARREGRRCPSAPRVSPARAWMPTMVLVGHRVPVDRGAWPRRLPGVLQGRRGFRFHLRQSRPPPSRPPAPRRPRPTPH